MQTHGYDTTGTNMERQRRRLWNEREWAKLWEGMHSCPVLRGAAWGQATVSDLKVSRGFPMVRALEKAIWTWLVWKDILGIRMKKFRGGGKKSILNGGDGQRGREMHLKGFLNIIQKT